jgi:hypothetical protein
LSARTGQRKVDERRRTRGNRNESGREEVCRMLWAVGSAVGLAVMTVVLIALARPVTARWEEEQAPQVTAEE